MDWLKRSLSALAVMAVIAGNTLAQEPAVDSENLAPRVAQTPAPRPPQVPARPAVPSATPPAAGSSTSTPGTTPTPATSTPTDTNANALATPVTPPPAANAAPNTNFVGSQLFAQQDSAFQASAGRRPSRTLEFLGDAIGGTRLSYFANGGTPGPPVPPPVPGPNPPPKPNGNLPNIVKRGAILLPNLRSFKMTEGQTPRPVDRVYYFTNYFDNVNQDINRQYGSQVKSIKALRNTIGFEKTFLEGRASLAAQVPLNSLYVIDPFTKNGGNTSTVGDLSLISKYAIYDDRETGNLFSTGLALTLPTGTSNFAGNRTVTNLHFMSFAPFVGYIWTKDRFFFQGFNSINVPTNSQDVTFLFNDFAIGYYVLRSENPTDFLTALAPTFETHINTPLNHRGGYLKDIAGTPDVVDLTLGMNAFFRERTKTAIGVVTPVTGPRPFSVEVMANISIRF
jgi:hypothetical protein